YPWMDTVAAIFVAFIIAKIGWELCSDSIRELVDTAIDDNRRVEIEHAILKITGVHGITSLRSRFSGGKIILELDLVVNPRITVSEGHQLGQLVSMDLLGKFSDIGDVVVHIDPEMHIESAIASELPAREQVLENIYSQLAHVIDREDIESIDLHYLDRGIELDVTVRLPLISEELREKIKEVLMPISHFTRLRIFNKLCELELDQKLS
ncbi:MAG: cation transporter dimerization domain-containing protein, partial [Pseudomonadales bacterium]